MDLSISVLNKLLCYLLIHLIYLTEFHVIFNAFSTKVCNMPRFVMLGLSSTVQFSPQFLDLL